MKPNTKKINAIINRVVEQLFEVYNDKSPENINSILTVCGGVMFSCMLTICEGNREMAIRFFEEYVPVLREYYSSPESTPIIEIRKSGESDAP